MMELKESAELQRTTVSLYSEKHSKAHKSARESAKRQAKHSPETSTLITSHVAEVKRRLDSSTKTNVENEAFILFLHLEPEANICPSSGKYFDQLTFISKVNQICKTLRVGLYVREHPDALRLPASDLECCKHLYEKHLQTRPKEFYEAIEAMDSFTGYMQSCSVTHIMKNNKTLGIISMSGSCMLQAAVNGKIGITATNNYYRELDHIFQIDDFAEIVSNGKMTINTIKQLNRHLPSQNEFQEALQKCTFISQSLRNDEYSHQEAEVLINALDEELMNWA